MSPDRLERCTNPGTLHQSRRIAITRVIASKRCPLRGEITWSSAYLLALFIAFVFFGGISSLLYLLEVGDYRMLSAMLGDRAKFEFGEYHGRLFAILGVCFIPLSVMVGLPGIYLLHRQRRFNTHYSVSLGVFLGLIAGSLVGFIEAKQSWRFLSVLLGIFWAFAYQRIVDPEGELAFETDACDRARRAALMLGVFDLIGLTLWCMLPYSEVVSIGVAAFLVVGPISVMPVASLAWARPSAVGLWLVLGGVVTGYLAVFQIPHPNLRGSLHFESMTLLQLVSIPMLVIGVWLLLARQR